MGWDPTTKILTAPISHGDISTAVQKASGDLGTLCQAPGINKWAKFKPTRATGVITPMDYWKGRSNDNPQTCGLSLPIVVTSNTPLQTFMQNLAGGPYNWTYLYPRGMAKDPEEWFRVLDFDGYDGRSVCPLPTPPSGVYTYSSERTFICDLPSQVTAGLSLDDLTSTASGSPLLSSYYIGLLLYKGTTRHWCTATVNIASGRGTSENKHLKVAFTLTGMTGEWNCRTFLCSTKLTQDQVPSDSTARWLIACEGVSTVTLTQTTGDYEIRVTRAKWIDETKVGITVEFVNGKSGTASVTAIGIDVLNNIGSIHHIDVANQSIPFPESYIYTANVSLLYEAGAKLSVTANFAGTVKTVTVDIANS